jgi:hypothetical protein
VVSDDGFIEAIPFVSNCIQLGNQLLSHSILILRFTDGDQVFFNHNFIELNHNQLDIQGIEYLVNVEVFHIASTAVA